MICNAITFFEEYTRPSKLFSLFSVVSSDRDTTLTLKYTFFFIRTSNFGAEAERCYRFEAENVLKTFSSYML